MSSVHERLLAEHPDLTMEQLLAAFPDVDPGVRPLGARVLVQIRSAKNVSKGGILLVDETKADEQWQTQVALVLRLGPFAFQPKDGGERQLNTWAQPGDLVRVPRWGGDRLSVSLGEGSKERALFCMFKDHELSGVVTINPLSVDNYYL